MPARDTKAKKAGLSEAASRIENAISWNDADQQINEYEDDDDEYDVDLYNGVCDDELDETACTVGTPTYDPELLDQIYGNLEGADASASQVYASTSRSFQEARDLLSRVKSARGYFPLVGICACDGLAQPSTDHKPAKSRDKGRWKVSKTPGVLPKPPTSRSESRPAGQLRTFLVDNACKCFACKPAGMSVLHIPRVLLFCFLVCFETVASWQHCTDYNTTSARLSYSVDIDIDIETMSRKRER